MKIYIIRHGQSMGNVKNAFCGFWDAPLSELGKKQARMTADYLKDFKIDKIYASPLSRAYLTALPIAENHELAIEKCDGLKEMNFGDWESLPCLSVEEKYNGAYSSWLREPWKTECPNGETMLEFYDRAVNALIEIAEKNKDKNICLATHGAWVKCILCHVKGVGPKNFQNVEYPANASVTTLEYSNGVFTLVEEGYCMHLGDDVTRVKV